MSEVYFVNYLHTDPLLAGVCMSFLNRIMGGA